jgi:hypothetical protein
MRMRGNYALEDRASSYPREGRRSIGAGPRLRLGAVHSSPAPCSSLPFLEPPLLDFSACPSLEDRCVPT